MDQESHKHTDPAEGRYYGEDLKQVLVGCQNELRIARRETDPITDSPHLADLV
jgi:hypothetical protein